MIEAAGEEEKDRLDNLNEFKSSIQEYINNNENPTLVGFLEENALVADVDRYDDTADAVVLMTIHSAKGLEFPIVILPGFEDGIFPGMQTMVGSEEDMEEERRLAYVALTRAKEQIYIMHTKSRLLFGQTQYNPLSRFVKEIPEKFIDENDKSSGAMFSQSVNSSPTVKTYFHDNSYNKFGGQGSRENSRTSVASGRTQAPSVSKTNAFRNTTNTPVFKKPSAPSETLSPGDRVRHMTFGDGEILSVRSMGADILYEVMFDKVGTKKLMATYAKLKKI
jgi:DNA helicase-2/ATP-dependent DNA helicase PcrA